MEADVYTAYSGMQIIDVHTICAGRFCTVTLNCTLFPTNSRDKSVSKDWMPFKYAVNFLWFCDLTILLSPHMNG